MKSFWKHLFIDNQDIALIEVGAQNFVPNQINDYNVKHDWVIHAVLSGQGFFQIDGKGYHLKAGDGFILRKNKHVYYVPDEKDPWSLCWVGLGGERIAHYFRETTLIQDNTLNFNQHPGLLHHFTDFVELFVHFTPQNISDKLVVFSKLYFLLAQINEACQIATHPIDSYQLSEPHLAEKVYDYISEHCLNNLTVLEVADAFDLSRNYLFRLCKSYYDQSPKQMIQELRMNQAAQLLRGSKMSIKEIANRIGYKDPFVFSKMFKKYYLVNPSEFRQLSEQEIDRALFIRPKFLEKQSRTK